MLRVRDDDDCEAFEELVENFQSRIVAVLHHMVGGQHEAEDLAQEVFLRVYKARKSYHPRARFSTWLFTIANNLALNRLRSKQRKPVVPLNLRESGPLGARPEEQLAQDRSGRPEDRLASEELSLVVQEALNGLNERQRMAVVLNKFEDMGYAEIAEVMELSTKAVKSLLSRARANLRQALRDYVLMDGEPVSQSIEDSEESND